MISDNELLNAIRLGEDTFLELKGVAFRGGRVSSPDGGAVSDELAAMANTATGRIVFGVDDRTHEPVGMKPAQLDVLETWIRQIRLHMFSDRLELFSPGGLPNTLAIEELAERQFARNELLCSALARCKIAEPIDGVRRQTLMDRRGEGVPIILSEGQALSGVRPTYELLGNSELKLVFRSASVQVGRKSVQKPVQDIPASVQELSASVQGVYVSLKANGHQTMRKIAADLKLNKDTVSVAIGELVKRQLVVRVGSSQRGHWEIVA